MVEGGQQIQRGQGIRPGEFITQRSPYTQFQSWLGETRGVIGCPINCQYCFFQLDGKTPMRPEVAISPQEMIEKLRGVPTYTPDMPINFGAETDAFSSRETVAYYTELLKCYGQSDFQNPVIFISKRAIPEEVMDIAVALPQPVLFYVSFSGLAGTAVEPTVRPEVLERNFIRLKERGLPGIHYWRPFLPQNSAHDVISRVLEFVSENAICSVANGLRLNDGIRAKMARFWPELVEQEFDFTQSGEFWPRGIRNFLIRNVKEQYPAYPVLFGNTTCSVAYALGRSDVYGHYNGSMCMESNCQAAQRKLCGACHRVPYRPEVEQATRQMGIPAEAVVVEEDKIVLQGKIESGKVAYLRYTLKFPVRSAAIGYSDGYNWANIRDEGNIIEVPWQNNWTE